MVLSEQEVFNNLADTEMHNLMIEHDVYSNLVNHLTILDSDRV